MIFLIHATDRPGSLEIRKATRGAHLEYLSGFDVPVGGPLLDDSGDMCGSCILLDVEDRAAAQDFVDGDPYGHADLFESVSINELKVVSWPT